MNSMQKRRSPWYAVALVASVLVLLAQAPPQPEPSAESPAKSDDAAPGDDPAAPGAKPATPGAKADAPGAKPAPGSGEAKDGAAKAKEGEGKTEAGKKGEELPPVVRKKPEELKGWSEAGGAGIRVYELAIDGTIDLGLAPFVERMVEAAGPKDIVLLRITTFGGRVDAAVRIRDALLGSKATTVAFVDGRAISAGALIAMACDTLIMGPGSSIGAATPVQAGAGGKMEATSEKVVSYMRAEMRATAEAKGRRADIAEAMVDADIEIPGITTKGKLLTMTQDKALSLGFADASAEDYEAALVLLNLKGAARVAAEAFWAEKVARVLTDPIVSSLLMTVGVLAIAIELYTPGFGVPGAVGIGCLTIFFLGQYVANLAGWEEAALFLVGATLLAIEIFVIPGFGVVGILGILCLVIALGMAVVEVELPVAVSWELGYLQEALRWLVIRLAVVTTGLMVGFIGLARWGPRSRFTSWLVFRAKKKEDDGDPEGLGAEAPGGSLARPYDDLEGSVGVTRSVLRPSGIVEFDGRRVHCLTDGEFLDPGCPVRVIEVDGHRVVVQSLPEEGSS